MKRNPFISRLATSVAAVALAIGSTFTFSACSDDDEVDNGGSKPVTRLEVPVVAAVGDEDIAENSLKFAWAAVEEATSYSAQIRLSQTGDIFRETITETTSAAFEGLSDGTEYYFRVRANNKYNESRNSAYSEWTVVETLAADPTRPTLPTPANPMCDMSKTTVSSLTFSWESVEGAAAYNVVLTSIGKDDVTATTTDTFYTFNGLEKGVKYYFTVQAAEIQGYNASKFSGVVYAITTSQLATPAGLSCTLKMSEAARFEWEAVENAGDYQYELAQIVSGSETIVMEGLVSEIDPSEIVPGKTVSASQSGTSVSFRGLSKDTYYSFRVKAVPSGDAYIESAFTDYCIIKTLVTDATPLAAPAPAVKEAQQLKVIFEWTAVANAFGYDYQFATQELIDAGDESAYTFELRAVSAEESESGEAVPLPTTVTVSKLGKGDAAVALTPNTTYKMRMKTIADPAKPTDGDSQWSEWMEVKTAELTSELTITADEELAESIARMADGGTLYLASGDYAVSDGIEFNRAITIAAAPAATTMPAVSMGVNPTIAGTVSRIVFSGLDIAVGKQYIFNTNSSAAYTLDLFKVTGCRITNLKRALLRTQDGGTTNVKAVVMENTTVICTGDDTYGVFVFKSNAPATYTFTDCTFDKVQKLVDHSANKESVVTATNCSFHQLQNKSGRSDAVFSMKGDSGVVNVSNCVFASTLPVNKIYVGTLATDSGNFFASDLVVTTQANTLPAATQLAVTQAELFPNVASGNYGLASGNAAYDAKAGDSRWYK
ncbi:fibronectin type III domain-containing protein [Alistipes sp.]|uniref:fibronectin type III domain-containing protein n=1 Tax=Alistipes sp. TaxID=1872444 RepID=UPI003AF02E4E